MAGEILERMSDTLQDEAASLLAGAALTTAAGYGRWLIARRLPARRTWRYPPNGDRLVVVVASSAQVDTGTYARPTTGVGQVRAMSLLMPVLVRAYRKVDLQQVNLSAHTPGRDLEDHLLLLGGPKNNTVTARALAEVPGLPMSVQGTVITWDGTDYQGQTDGGTVVRDVGYVVRAPNPFAPHRRLVVVAGSHTFGTVAAARWLSESGGERTVPPDVAVLVEADVRKDGHVGVPRVLETAPLRHG